jgi:UDP-glucose 4-epimerase
MPGSRPQRLLVTGGRGRLASLIADHFRAPAHEVVLYSRGGDDGFLPLEELSRPADLAGTDALLHLAWSTLPATAEKNPGAEQQHDLPLLEILLQAAAARQAHFIFFSSGGAVYGNAPGRPNVEGDPCQPIGLYGRAKLAAEKRIEQAARQGLPCTILRISNPYGYPVPTGRVQGIIPHAIRCAVEGRPLTLWGDGHARKDFLYYTDFLSALDEVVARRLTGTFNLCAGESHSVHEIIALVEKHTSRKISTEQIAAPAWDVQDSRLDHRRLTEATGWQPQVPLDEGIRRAAAGYRDR